MLSIDDLLELAARARLTIAAETFAAGGGADGEAPRVRYLYEHILPLVADRIPTVEASVAKSASRSDERRREGNARFGERKYKEALEAYTKAALEAPTGSEQLRLAYGNRSAALFELKKRDACLADVRRALELDPDDKLREKLERRRRACEEIVPKKADRRDPIVDEKGRQLLFAPPSDALRSYPCASSALEVVYSKECGRSVIATRDIAVGETLALEKPYLTLLLESHFRSRCYECCEPCDCLLPCDGCSEVAFCSEECRQNSKTNGHAYECPIMSVLVGMQFTKIELLSLRTVIRARGEYESWDELREAVRSIEAETDPLKRGFSKSTDENGVEIQTYNSTDYAAVHALETNLDKRMANDVCNKCFTAATLLRLLRKHTSFFDDCREHVESKDPNSHFWFVGGLLFHHIMTSASNMHSLEALVEKSQQFLETEHFCSAAYPFLSLINHSCAPNVTRLSSGWSTALVVLRPIEKGQELLDNYGQHHALQTKLDRQQSLLFQYKFKCACEACVEQWPLYFGLRPANLGKKGGKRIDNIINSDLIEKLQKGDKSYALSILKKLYKNVSILESHAPCKELADHQETIKQCWALFGNVVYED